MEKLIEATIDNGLENISSQLYIFSIAIGIIIVILGVILLLTNKSSKERKKLYNSGLICLVIGIVAIISGFIQI